MSFIGLLHSLHDILVDAEAKCDSKDCQRQVSQDTENGEECQGQKDKHHTAKHDTRLLHIPPVDQIQHWNL